MVSNNTAAQCATPLASSHFKALLCLARHFLAFLDNVIEQYFLLFPLNFAVSTSRAVYICWSTVVPRRIIFFYCVYEKRKGDATTSNYKPERWCSPQRGTRRRMDLTKAEAAERAPFGKTSYHAQRV